MKIFRFCKSELRQNIGQLSLFYLLTIVYSLLTLYYTYFTGAFLDKLVQISTVDSLIWICLFLVAICVISTCLGYFVSILSAKVTMRLGFAISKKVIEHLHRARLADIYDENSVSLTDKLTSDSNNVTSFCTNTIYSVLMNILFVIIPAFFLIKTDVRLAVVLVIVLLVYFVAYKRFRKPLYGVSLNYKNSTSEYMSDVNDQIKFIRHIKINSLYSNFISRLKKSFSILYDNTIRLNRVSSAFSGLDSFIMRVAQICIFLIGGYGVLNGSFTIGKIVIVMNFFNMTLNGVRYFFGLGKTYQETVVSYNRLKHYMDIESDRNGEILINQIRTVSLQNFGFSYGDDALILSNINCEFSQGYIYGIIGENGTGKSTLVYNLLGLFEGFYHGEIKYNNINICKLNMEKIRQQQISFLEQDDLLLSDTILDNLYNDNSDLDKKIVEEISSVLNISDFLKENQTRTVSSTFSNISGGQRKKIALIKTLAKDASLIILDEPTASLDANSISNLYEYLDTIKHSKIIIIISHDNQLSEICDNTIQLKSYQKDDAN